MTYFDRAITPNEAFFVRYHIFPIPTSIDLLATAGDGARG